MHAPYNWLDIDDIAEALAGIDPATVLAGPDAESRQWFGDLAARLGLEYAVGHKARRSDRSVEIGFAGAVPLSNHM